VYIIEAIKRLEEFHGKVALTIGNFEGFHRGHLRIIRTLAQISKDRGLFPTVLTFKQHPLSVLLNKKPEKLSAPSDKIMMFEKEGIELLLYVDFSRQFADLDALSFLSFLKSTIGPRLYCLGQAFRFGRGNQGDTGFLKKCGPQFGYELILVDDVSWGKLPVSSTRIRNEVKNGNFKLVKNLLGKRYYVYLVRVQPDSFIFSSFFPDWALPMEGRFSGCLEEMHTGKRADVEITTSKGIFEVSKGDMAGFWSIGSENDRKSSVTGGTGDSSGIEKEHGFEVETRRFYRFYFSSACSK